jgi:putative membrane protein
MRPAAAAGFGGGFEMTLARLLGGAALIGLMVQPVLAQSQDKAQPQQPQQQQQQTTNGGAQQQLAQKDIDFAKKAAGDGMAEVKLGKLAQLQAQNDQVKAFGQRMVDDHGKANDKLKSIAQQKGIDLPQSPPDEAQQAYNDLQKKTGHAFDQAYMDMMVKDHHKAIDLFQQEAKAGKDADLQKFAEQTLPILQQHLDLAQKTQQQVNQQMSASADQGQQGAPKLTKEPNQVTAPPTGNQQQQAMTKEPTATGPAKTPPPATAKQQAATEATTPPPAVTPPANKQQQAAAQPTGQQMSAQDVIGTKVVNNKGDQVGTVKDLVIDQDQVQYAVVSVGGFLGIGAKNVAIPLDQLKLGKDKTYLMSAQTEGQLKQMPAYQDGTHQKQG